MNKSFGAYSDIQICKDITARLLTPGESTEVGYRALLQGISVSQGSNLRILHHRRFFTAESLLCKNIAREHHMHTSKVRGVVDGKPGPGVY